MSENSTLVVHIHRDGTLEALFGASGFHESGAPIEPRGTDVGAVLIGYSKTGKIATSYWLYGEETWATDEVLSESELSEDHFIARALADRGLDVSYENAKSIWLTLGTVWEGN